MVGGTTQQPSQLAPPLSSTAPATTPEEDELLKRNTDCVYFLASPLTCKKGSECEYRHSDVARVNPRDCWYWLNGSCLNPKCAFRHPPLDGLLGADVSTAVGPSVPPPHPAPYTMPKQGVACIFFQKGYCLKGHLCPFVHGPPNSINNKPAQSGPTNPISEPPKTGYSGPEKSFQDQKLTQPATAQKPVEFPVPQTVRTQAPPVARNGGDKKAPPPVSSSVGVADPPKYKSARVVPPPVVSEKPAGKPNRGGGGYHHTSDNDRVLNGKDADEYSREPSPGFDVLVDNELGDSEYYRNKDEFGRSRGNEYDLDRLIDYEVDREMYRDYEHYNERQGDRYAWDERRSSSERVLVGSGHVERRSYPRRSASPDHFDGSDLRHRISKQRRVSDNGLRSVVSHEGRVPRRESHHHHHHNHRQEQGGLSSRLRGRIKIPERSVSPNNGRPPPAVNHGRLRDRIKDANNDPRDYKGFSRIPDNDSKFAGPKRLSELKKGYEPQPQVNDERQFLGKRKYPNEEDLSFEGPKPLSEILKSKRGSETTRIKNNPDSHVNNKEKRGSEATRVKNNPDSHVNSTENNEMVAEKEENNSVSAIVEPEKQTGSEEKLVSAIVEPEKQKYSDSAIDEDALLDEELEGYEDGEGEYEYVDGEEEYNMDEEGEYVDEEEEYGNENENGKKEESVVC